MVSKTGRGSYITPFGMRRKALHTSKRGGSSSLLLSPGLGASDGGVGGTQEGMGLKRGGQLPLHQEKPAIENVQKRLEALSIRGGTKRKNVSFKI
jgi:hypothetical protein